MRGREGTQEEQEGTTAVHPPASSRPSRSNGEANRSNKVTAGSANRGVNKHGGARFQCERTLTRAQNAHFPKHTECLQKRRPVSLIHIIFPRSSADVITTPPGLHPEHEIQRLSFCSRVQLFHISPHRELHGISYHITVAELSSPTLTDLPFPLLHHSLIWG